MKKEESNRPADIEPVKTYSTKGCPVNQYSLEGKFIQTFKSIKEASRQTKTTYGNLFKCLNGELKTAHGFQWRRA